MSDSISRAVEQILHRTGIGKQIAAENESNRAAKHAELRQRKAAAIAAFLKSKPAAEAQVAAAEKKAQDARRLADEAAQDYMKARNALETVYGTLTGVVEPVEREMVTCYDPAIDAFVKELEDLKSGCTNLYRAWPDPKSLLKDSAGQPVSDNQAQIQNRIRVILEVQDAAKRLKIHPDVDDVPAELDRLRKSIPEA